MTLAQWCLAVGPVGRYRRRLAKLYAFLGRYMHQSEHHMGFKTVRQLMLLANATRDILEEEKEQFDTLRSPD